MAAIKSLAVELFDDDNKLATHIERDGDAVVFGEAFFKSPESFLLAANEAMNALFPDRLK